MLEKPFNFTIKASGNQTELFRIKDLWQLFTLLQWFLYHLTIWKL